MVDITKTTPANTFAAVTTSDTANLASTARALFVGTAGNMVVVGADGVAVTFKNVAAGTLLPLNAVRVNATSTTAADIVALY